MRTGLLAVHCFLGTDGRSLAQILHEDQLLVERLGLSHELIAQRLHSFSSRAVEGRKLILEGYFEVEREEHKGSILCPFAHGFQAGKSITRVHNLRLGKGLAWSDLNIHLIAEHGFYEGIGAPFRLDPAECAEVLEISPGK